MDIKEIKKSYPILSVHEEASKIPAMRPERYRATLRDIIKNGMVNPIWVKDGQIIDGRHRYQIIQKLYKHHRLNFDPDIREWPTGNIKEAIESLNIHRRHLSQSQLAAIAVENLLPAIETESAKRMKAGKPLSKGVTGVSIELAAKQVGTNKEYIRILKSILRDSKNIELFKFIRSGQLKVGQVQKLVELDEITRDNILHAMDTHNLTYGDSIKRLNIEAQPKNETGEAKKSSKQTGSNLDPQSASDYTLAGVLTMDINPTAQEELIEAFQAVLHKHGYTKQPIKLLFAVKSKEAREIIEQHYEDLKNLSYEYGCNNPEPLLIQ